MLLLLCIAGLLTRVFGGLPFIPSPLLPDSLHLSCHAFLAPSPHSLTLAHAPRTHTHLHVRARQHPPPPLTHTLQDVLGCLLVFGTCIMCVALEARLSPAAAGLAVSNSFQILLFLSLMVRTAAAIHVFMGSVDRLHALATVPPEPDLPPAAAPRLAANWPTAGEVEFQNVVMSYLPSAPHVLKGVSFRCHAGEKVGIVGRTGAGKSSLIMAMFRLALADSGAVRIDGVDVSKLSLKDLRQRIAIIPQEPVMFEGTLRSVGEKKHHKWAFPAAPPKTTFPHPPPPSPPPLTPPHPPFLSRAVPATEPGPL